MDGNRHNDEVIIAELRALKELLTLEIANTKDQVRILQTQAEKYGERIRVIELWQSNSMGRLAVIFTIIGMLIAALSSWLVKQF